MQIVATATDLRHINGFTQQNDIRKLCKESVHTDFHWVRPYTDAVDTGNAVYVNRVTSLHVELVRNE